MGELPARAADRFTESGKKAGAGNTSYYFNKPRFSAPSRSGLEVKRRTMGTLFGSAEKILWLFLPTSFSPRLAIFTWYYYHKYKVDPFHAY
jgi:hypothetical protein